MSAVEEARPEIAEMPAAALLRHLLLEQFPKTCVVTSSLRARSIVVLHMIAEIDCATPVVFCHAPYVYPESVEYRGQIVRRLGLADVRDPQAGESGAAAGDRDHYEAIRSDIWGGGTIETIVHLNRSLAGFECWISAAYHRPYGNETTPRLHQEGGLLRVDPLRGWSRDAVHEYMAGHRLPFHPRILPPTHHY